MTRITICHSSLAEPWVLEFTNDEDAEKFKWKISPSFGGSMLEAGVEGVCWIKIFGDNISMISEKFE